MSLYTTIDTLADLINPGLGLLAVAQLVFMTAKQQWRTMGIYMATLLALTTVIYGWMAIDRKIFDLPYSTHSAFALCFCTLHAVYMPKLKFVWLALLLAYLSLILFQGYHSLTDIGITFIMVAPISAVIIILSKRFSALSQHR